MQLFSQRDPRWAGHPLGYGVNLGSIGNYGCFLTVLTMIAWDSFQDMHYLPSKMDELLAARKVFVSSGGGTYDLLPDNALDRVWTARFQTRVLAGWQPAAVAAAVRSKDTYAVLWIHTAAVPTHFVIAYSADAHLIADPWTGKVGYLAGYGGPAAVHKVILVRKVQPPAPAPAPAPAPPVGPLPSPGPVPAPPPPPPPPPPPEPTPEPPGQVVPPSVPVPPAVEDASLQGLLVLLLNYWLKLMGRR